jgi:hypothetical protein
MTALAICGAAAAIGLSLTWCSPGHAQTPPAGCIGAMPAVATDPESEPKEEYWLVLMVRVFKCLEWLDSTWLGTTTRNTFWEHDWCCRWEGKWPKSTTVLYIEEGGIIGEHVQRWRQIAATNADIEIRGPCFSACTLIIGILPKERICFDEYASLHFHAARELNGRIALDATIWMHWIYPREIRDWLMAKGGPTKMTVHEFWELEAPDLWAMGYRKCKAKPAPVMTLK